MVGDIINGCFEGFSSLFILNHVRVLWKTRQAYGISLTSNLFFTAWGIWNIYYYPSLDQMVSFYAGIAILLANICWNFSIWYIRRQQRAPNQVRSNL